MLARRLQSLIRVGSSYSHVRFSSLTKPDPKERALKLLNLVPGSSLLSKTGTLTVGTGLVAFLISKELILLHSETLVLACFIGVTYLLYKNTSGLVTKELDARTEELRKSLSAGRERTKASLEEQIHHALEAKEMTNIQKDLLEVTKEIVKGQQELAAREVRHRIANQIRHRLDYIATLETQIKQAEQRSLLERVQNRVMLAIQDPKIQESLLQKSVAEVEAAALKS
jgi:F-type H+-transporting ATPase subunit b